MTSALKNYAAFRKNVSATSPSAGGRIITLAWPGSFSYLQGRWLRYREAIHYSKEAAEVLKKYLRQLQEKGLNITLIGHSLGCRLILEMLEQLRLDPAKEPDDIQIILMAAAVRVAAVSGELSDAAKSARDRAVLYSPADMVLAWVFHFGELSLGNAVGLTGEPRKVWTRTVATRLKHKEYWPDSGSAQTVCDILGVGGRRPIATNVLPTRQIPSRSLLWSTHIPREYFCLGKGAHAPQIFTTRRGCLHPSGVLRSRLPHKALAKRLRLARVPARPAIMRNFFDLRNSRLGCYRRVLPRHPGRRFLGQTHRGGGVTA